VAEQGGEVATISGFYSTNPGWKDDLSGNNDFKSKKLLEKYTKKRYDNYLKCLKHSITTCRRAEVNQRILNDLRPTISTLFVSLNLEAEIWKPRQPKSTL
jgi:hypothetical protein